MLLVKMPEYLGVEPLGPRRGVLYSSVEVHGQHEFRAGLLPWVSMPEPIICLFHLQKGHSLECGFQEVWTQPFSHATAENICS